MRSEALTGIGEEVTPDCITKTTSPNSIGIKALLLGPEIIRNCLPASLTTYKIIRGEDYRMRQKCCENFIKSRAGCQWVLIAKLLQFLEICNSLASTKFIYISEVDCIKFNTSWALAAKGELTCSKTTRACSKSASASARRFCSAHSKARLN